jgi:hypothetical protein
MQIDEQLDDMSIDEIAEGQSRPHSPLDMTERVELPENAPRYVVISYELVSRFPSSNRTGLTDRNILMDVFRIHSFSSIGKSHII